jgi:hypothetical protein
MDWRVLKERDLFPSSLTAAKQDAKREIEAYTTDDWTAQNYIDEYLPRVKERKELWGCTLRDADRILWGLSVSRRINELVEKS